MDIEVCTDPVAHLDDWCRLYGELVMRKNITGICAFSRSAFEQQLVIPGTVLFRASEGEQTIALDWWYVQGEGLHRGI